MLGVFYVSSLYVLRQVLILELRLDLLVSKLYLLSYPSLQPCRFLWFGFEKGS